MTADNSFEGITSEVLEFYKELPFNYKSNAGIHAEEVLRFDIASTYPTLAKILNRDTRVLELGCGTGWLSLAMNLQHQCHVHGVDINPVVIDRARDVSDKLGAGVTFEVQNLFEYVPSESFDVVVSMGVLHHTPSVSDALERICTELLDDGGHAFIGLYHAWGRKPFLEHFETLKASRASEQDLFQEYKLLHSWLDDELHLQSWFKDQVLHPHETHHTLEEVLNVIQPCGCEIIDTSLNQYAPISDLQKIIDAEYEQETIARKKLKNGTYFPGFFTFTIKK